MRIFSPAAWLGWYPDTEGPELWAEAVVCYGFRDTDQFLCIMGPTLGSEKLPENWYAIDMERTDGQTT